MGKVAVELHLPAGIPVVSVPVRVPCSTCGGKGFKPRAIGGFPHPIETVNCHCGDGTEERRIPASDFVTWLNAAQAIAKVGGREDG